MKVTKITLGRLYNLGSYEHVRYEITCEVPDGESASTALVGMEKLLCALNPKRPCGVPSREEAERAANAIVLMKGLSDEDFRRNYNYAGNQGTREQITARHERDLAEGIARLNAWEERQKHARTLFDDLGGVAKWKDAKQDWDDDY